MKGGTIQWNYRSKKWEPSSDHPINRTFGNNIGIYSTLESVILNELSIYPTINNNNKGNKTIGVTGVFQYPEQKHKSFNSSFETAFNRLDDIKKNDVYLIIQNAVNYREAEKKKSKITR